MDVIKKLLAAIRKADFDFGLISKGDKIMVGVSGGKDSVALIKLLSIYQKFADKDFTFEAVMLDLGFPAVDLKPLKDFCSALNVPFTVYDSREVYPILCQHMHNGILPCSICSRMKKAAINKVANTLGYKKVSFAHHADDAIETFFMNMIHGGRLATFSPSMHLERADIDFIRPLIYAREKDIQALVRQYKLPVIKSKCQNDHESERAVIKEELKKIYDKFPDSYQNFLTMLLNKEKADLWFDKKGFNDGNGVKIIEARNYQDYIDCLNIRFDVFVEEIGFDYSEEFVYDDEKNTVSYLLSVNDKSVGTIRYKIIDDSTYMFQRFAVLKEYRKNGYGSLLFDYLEKILSRKKTPMVIYLYSRKEIVDYYLSKGYVIDGEEVLIDQKPHYKLKKSIYHAIMDKSKER